MLRGDDFLDGDTHPEIAFRSHEVRLGPDGPALVEGDLPVARAHELLAHGDIPAELRARLAALLGRLVASIQLPTEFAA